MDRTLIDLIKEEVSIYDLFEEAQPRIKYISREKECQISCPFHGADLAKSARVYPQTNSMYCWTCGISWDVIDFWANLNEWWKDGRLDAGKAISDLMERYDLERLKPTWKEELDKILFTLSKKTNTYEDYDERARESAYLNFSWLISRKIQGLPTEDREALWPQVERCWDDFSAIDLTSPSWKDDLDSWRLSLNFLYGKAQHDII